MAVAVLALWSFGVMHNVAYRSAALRHQHLIDNMRSEGRVKAHIRGAEGLSPSLSLADTQCVPDWVSTLNMCATVLSFVLLVWALLARLAG